MKMWLKLLGRTESKTTKKLVGVGDYEGCGLRVSFSRERRTGGFCKRSKETETIYLKRSY